MNLKIILIFSLLIIQLNSSEHRAKKIGDKTIGFSNGIIKKGGHRNWRNNNPGNLEYGKFSKENGAIGTDGRFAIFKTMKDGYIAHVKLLSGSKYKNLTLSQAIYRFAPSHENNTKKYIKYLSKNTGINKRKRLKTLSFNKKLELVKYMAKYEGMKKGYLYKTNKSYSTFKTVNNKYAIAKTKKTFENILNPKRTKLHNILLSN